MADPATLTALAIGVSAAVSAAGTGYQIKNSMDQEDQAKAAAKQQAEAQQKLLNDQKAQQDQAQKEADQEKAAALQTANRQNSNASKIPAALSTGPSSTILTSPLGVTNAPNQQPAASQGAKTLLGM